MEKRCNAFFSFFFAFHLDLCYNIRMINIIFGIFFTSTNIWPLWISSFIQITDREADEITSIFSSFFFKRKQKDLSAVFVVVVVVFQNQPQISWQTFLRGRAPATGNRTFFPTLSHTPCSTVTSLAAETAMHFFCRWLSWEHAWKALMSLSLWRISVAKWLFYVWLSHRSIFINIGDRVFLLSV